jgi:hypothetical protein
MKNKYILLTAISILIISILGCSYYNPLQGSSNSNDKTLSEKTVDKTIGEEKIGIRECDQVIEDLADLAKNKDDDFVTKAGKEVVLNKIRENLKKSIEENKKDKAKLAKDCQEYKKQIDQYKTSK